MTVRRSLMTAIALFAVALAGCSGGGEDRRQDGAADDETPTLSHRKLTRVFATPENARERMTTSAAPSAVWSEDTIVVVSADNKMRAFDRSTLRKTWQAKLPVDSVGRGLCERPWLTADDLVVVLIGIDCDRFIARDAETGKLVSDRRSVDERIGSHVITHNVADTTATDERVWYAAYGQLGYVDDTGRPIGVLGKKALGIRAGSYDALHEVSWVPGTDLLVASMIRDDGDSDGRHLPLEYLGIGLGEDDTGAATATVLWHLPETGVGRLGVAGAKKHSVIEMQGLEPGGLLMAALGNGGLAAGQPSATGRLEHPVAVPPKRQLSLTEGARASTPPAYTVFDHTLYVTTRTKGEDEYFYPRVSAYDLDSGDHLWTTTLPNPAGPDDEDGFNVENLHVGEDGHLYAVATDRWSNAVLHRLDAETGKRTLHWRLPGGLNSSYFVRVVGDTVLAVLADEPQNPDLKHPGMVLLRNRGAQRTGSSPS